MIYFLASFSSLNSYLDKFVSIIYLQIKETIFLTDSHSNIIVLDIKKEH